MQERHNRHNERRRTKAKTSVCKDPKTGQLVGSVARNPIPQEQDDNEGHEPEEGGHHEAKGQEEEDYAEGEESGQSGQAKLGSSSSGMMVLSGSAPFSFQHQEALKMREGSSGNSKRSIRRHRQTEDARGLRPITSFFNVSGNGGSSGGGGGGDNDGGGDDGGGFGVVVGDTADAGVKEGGAKVTAVAPVAI